MKLIKSEKLKQFSNAPLQEWEERCREIAEQIERGTCLVPVTRKGYQVRYPVGSVEKVENGSLYSWIKASLPITEETEIPSPYGTVQIAPLEWEEIVTTKPRIDYPPKPEPIAGFNWQNKTEVARLINQQFGFDWTWMDVPSLKPEIGYYVIAKYTDEVIEESAPLRDGDGDGGYFTYTNRTYRTYKLHIYADRWEMFEDSETRRHFPDRRSTDGYSVSTSRDCDGFWNK